MNKLFFCHSSTSILKCSNQCQYLPLFDKCTDVIDLTSNHDDDLKRALRLSLQDHKGQSSGISYEDQQLSRLVQLHMHVLLYMCLCSPSAPI